MERDQTKDQDIELSEKERKRRERIKLIERRRDGPWYHRAVVPENKVIQK